MIVSGFVIGLFLPWVSEKLIVGVQQADAEMRKEDKTLYHRHRADYATLGGGCVTAFILLYLGERLRFFPETPDFSELVIFSITVPILIVLARVDWVTYTIPPVLNVLILTAGLIRLGLDYRHWSLYVIGFFAVSVILWLLYQISGGRWIGGGDVKLMAAAGLLMGWQRILVSFVLGCVLGSIIHLLLMYLFKKEHGLAFGPYLSLGIFCSMIFGQQIVNWYSGLLKV